MSQQSDGAQRDEPANAQDEYSKAQQAKILKAFLELDSDELISRVLEIVGDEMSWDDADGINSQTVSSIENGELVIRHQDPKKEGNRLNTLAVNHKSPLPSFEILEDGSSGPWKDSIDFRESIPNKGIIEDPSGLKVSYRDCLAALIDWIGAQDLVYGCQMSLWNESILAALVKIDAQIILQYEEWMFYATGNSAHPHSRRLYSVNEAYSRIRCSRQNLPWSPNFPNSLRPEDIAITNDRLPGIYLFKEVPSTPRRVVSGNYSKFTERLMHHKFFIGGTTRVSENEFRDEIKPNDLDAHSIAYGTFNCSEAARGNLESLMIMPASRFPEFYSSLRREFLAIKSSNCTFADWDTFKTYATRREWPTPKI